MIAQACQQYPVTTIASLIGACLVNELFEYWIGKTEKYSAGSKIELILTGLAALAVLFTRKKKNDPTTNR